MTALKQREHTFPAAQALQLVDLVKRWQVSPNQLLAELGLSELALEDPQARLSFATMKTLLVRARALSGEPGFGFYLGLQRRASMYGFLGFAAMSAATLRDSLELAVQFAPVISTAVSLRLRVEGSSATLIIEEHADFGSVRDVTLISFLMGLQQIGSALTGRTLTTSIDVALPAPAYLPRFAHLIPGARFGQPVTQIMFDAADLDLPLTTPDRAASRLARQQCEQALLALGLEGSIVERVSHVMAKADGFRSLDEVAAVLHLSTRTLKRRLAEHDTTFSALLDRERRQRALLLLRSSQIPLAQVTHRLGYATVPNFVRAFRKWTGKTPASYRLPRARRLRYASTATTLSPDGLQS